MFCKNTIACCSGRFAVAIAIMVVAITSVPSQSPPRHSKTDIFGEYATTWGKVLISMPRNQAGIRFSIEVVHNDGRGCVGDLTGKAKYISRNSYRYIEDVDATLGFGSNIQYLLTFSFSNNRMTIRETSKGNEAVVNLYHGAACTFNGTYKRIK